MYRTSHLEWDSHFLGYRVAEIRASDGGEADLAAALQSLSTLGVHLAYWFGPGRSPPTDGELRIAGAEFIDHRITFVIELPGGRTAAESPVRIDRFHEGEPTAALRALAIAAGSYSRFRRDPRFGVATFEALYQRWIDGCISGSLADAIFVARDEGRETGIVTVRCRGEVATIGLIAVHAEARNWGLGSDLVSAARVYAEQRDCRRLEVTTQRDNRAGCRLYERSGLTSARSERIAHFWINR